MSNPASAGAGRDGSRLRQRLELLLAEANNGAQMWGIQHHDEARKIADIARYRALRDVLALLAVPDHIASDTGQEEPLPACINDTVRRADVVTMWNDWRMRLPADGPFRHSDGVDFLNRLNAIESAPLASDTGQDMITAERQRQMAVEGWTPDHDDSHLDGEMIEGARSYLSAAFLAERGRRWNGPPPPLWPWNQSWWKPSDDPIRNLVKAGALIAAEIDRLKRASSAPLASSSAPQGEKKNESVQ